MKRFLIGLVIGITAAVGGGATAATLGDWRSYENDGLVCSIGKKGTSVGHAGTCVMYGGKWNGWSFAYDRNLGIRVANGAGYTMLGRGRLGGG